MLSSNDKLGPYEIIAPIGKGGMGEVYRARDSRVGREVAIKTSLEQFSERFEREARTIAALNHPNICTLHDVGDNYIVMEFVEGETLAERLKRGPIALEESLHIARQIADALEAAHEKGIVHRDLKPGNVIVKPDGSVKVLDFGLAKQTASGATGSSEDSPTLSMAATQAGVILGTAAYMAPEQARGKSVDKRADIWAFGAVLFEMVTGRRLFRGDDLTDTLAAVVRDKPDLNTAPPQLRRLLEACLQKEPRQRLRDIADVWRLLDGPQAENQLQGKSRALIWPTAAAAVLMTVLAGVALWAPWRKPPAAPELMKLEVSPPKGTTIGKFAVSPDGRKIAYFASGSESKGLWVRSLSDLTPVRVGGNFDVAGIPSFFWSADSRFVAFATGNPFNRLVLADSEGGPPQRLAEIGTTVFGGSWSPDGTVLFGSLTPGVFRVSANGGNPVQITAGDPSRPATGHCCPILLPDGKHFLYFVLAPATGSGMFVGSIDAKPNEQSKERIVSTEFAAAFAPTPDPNIGILLFRRDDTLLAQKLDLRTFQLTGAPTRIASGVAAEVEFGGLSASKDVLAYHTGPTLNSAQLNLTWSNPRGETLGTPAGVGSLGSGIALSPDGSRAAVTRLDPNTAGTEIWLLDFARSNAISRLTSGTGRRRDPVWSSDGNQIAYVSIDKGAAALARRPSSGSGAEEVVLPSNGKERHLNDWSRNGRFLLFAEQSEKTKSDLWVVPLDGERKPELFLNSEFNETEGQFSPDGHWIAYVSDETGQPRIYIQPFPRGAGGVGKIAVSNDQGVMPRWRRDGKGLFYLQVSSTMAVEFASTPAPRAGIPRLLFQSPVTFIDVQSFLWDVAPSGDRFLLTTFPVAPASEAPLTVLLNWQRMLEK